MQGEKKVAAAITTAVYAYIQADEQKLAQSTDEKSGRHDWFRPYPVISPWSFSGRQAMMDWRRQLQFRIPG